MNRYKRAIIQDREARAKELHAPKTDEDRIYHTQLAIFEVIMKAVREGEARGLTGQEQARFADDLAAQAATKVAEIWKAEEQGAHDL